MKPILFFNFFHNGDLFNSKPFVKEIMANIPTEYFYVHGKRPRILQDLDLKTLHLKQVFPLVQDDYKQKFILADNAVLVNTWIGAYFEPDGECTLNFSYNMYKKIYKDINTLYNSNLSLGSNIVDYFPSVDFSKFDLTKVDEYLSKNTGRKILICNGPALSGQCSYNGNMKEMVVDLANTYKDITFICTHKLHRFECDLPNVAYTDDIIAIDDCDLNEISYLSTFCDTIIGRSSGPFSFSCIKDNMNDEKKKFICFGDKITDCFQYGIDTKANFAFEKYSTSDNLLDTIKKEINV